MIIGNRKFENYTYVFAIVNLTPDSFYAPSRNDEYSVLKTVERAVKEIGRASCRERVCMFV